MQSNKIADEKISTEHKKFTKELDKRFNGNHITMGTASQNKPFYPTEIDFVELKFVNYKTDASIIPNVCKTIITARNSKNTFRIIFTKEQDKINREKELQRGPQDKDAQLLAYEEFRNKLDNYEPFTDIPAEFIKKRFYPTFEEFINLKLWDAEMEVVFIVMGHCRDGNITFSEGYKYLYETAKKLRIKKKIYEETCKELIEYEKHLLKDPFEREQILAMRKKYGFESVIPSFNDFCEVVGSYTIPILYSAAETAKISNRPFVKCLTELASLLE